MTSTEENTSANSPSVEGTQGETDKTSADAIEPQEEGEPGSNNNDNNESKSNNENTEKDKTTSHISIEITADNTATATVKVELSNDTLIDNSTRQSIKQEHHGKHEDKTTPQEGSEHHKNDEGHRNTRQSDTSPMSRQSVPKQSPRQSPRQVPQRPSYKQSSPPPSSDQSPRDSNARKSGIGANISTTAETVTSIQNLDISANSSTKPDAQKTEEKAIVEEPKTTGEEANKDKESTDKSGNSVEGNAVKVTITEEVQKENIKIEIDISTEKTNEKEGNIEKEKEKEINAQGEQEKEKLEEKQEQEKEKETEKAKEIEKEKETDTETKNEENIKDEPTDDTKEVPLDGSEKIGHVFRFGEGMVYKVDSIESGKVTCVRVSGTLDFPKGIFITEEMLKKLKPRPRASQQNKETEYSKGFEFEINALEYRVDTIDGTRATCIRVTEHDGSPGKFEMPLKQLEKMETKPREETESNLARGKSRVEEVKEHIETADKNKKIEKKRVSYVVEDIQVKVKASVFEEKAKETSPPVKEETTSPKRPKPIGNLASRTAGLNIDPTKLKQGAYDAAKAKKKRGTKIRTTTNSRRNCRYTSARD